MKKILVFVNSFNFGGITSLIQDIYRNLDRSKYRVSFVRPDWNRNAFDEEVLSNGDKVYYIESEKLNRIPLINYIVRTKHMIKKVCKAVGKDQYDVAYIHANAYYAVPSAKKIGIPKIIMHSHEAVSDFNGNEKKSQITNLIWKNRVRMYNRLVDYKLGDSKKACIAKFGENVVSDQNMMVVNPPINMEKFNPSAYSADDIPCEVDTEKNTFNMVHVGRLCAVKNQKFLIDILSEIIKVKDSNLYIVGEGDSDKEMLTQYAMKKGVSEKVTFLKGDTSPAIYKVMNCSLLPSFSEAFGMVAVESQLMGVPCFASTNVPDDVDTGMCSFLDLSLGAKEWATKILEYNYNDARLDIEEKDRFDINNIIKTLEKIFEAEKGSD